SPILGRNALAQLPDAVYGPYVRWCWRSREAHSYPDQRNVMEYPGRGSLAFDARRLDHVAPLFGKLDNEFGELGGRACKWFRAQIDEPRFDLRISKGGINL